jgi:fucose permease
MSELAYLGSILLAVAAYIVGAWLLWQVVEGVYWVYCKITGKEY